MELGAQVYTIREYCQTEADFTASMEKVAKIGYKTIQLSGAGPMPAATVRRVCDGFGLRIPTTHWDAAAILRDTERVIEDHRTLGASYIGLGAMPGPYEKNAEGIKRFIGDYQTAADKIKAAGMKFMYHNHDFEFEKFGGKLLYDALIDGFDRDAVGFTLDTFWVQAGGGDSAWWLEKLAGRVDTIHFKDMAMLGGKRVMMEVMEGNLNWPAIFKACETAGVRWTFIEQDDCNGKDPFACLKTSYDNLAKAGYR